ncbi:MAG: tetratricopeptide repeat protein [Anaerolineales bacterium]|nr:tetratricopeptide repeat protein [Anaerolineales bacterium]
MNIKQTISKAKELRRADELDESQELLLSLLDEYPNDPQVLFEVGGAYDVLDEARIALSYYQKAIDAGLEGDSLEECLVCIGVCQRGLGEMSTAVATLEKAVAQFPDNNSSRVFLALAYYSDGQDDKAVQLLLDLLITTTQDPEILEFAGVFDYYKDNLDEVWDN